MNIIIPMAGHSRRFKKAGYQVPKPFIKIGDQPMIAHVVDMFSPSDKFHFIMNTEQAAENQEWVHMLKHIVPNSKIIVIEPHEKGPVFSALQAENIPDDEEVIISYCDFIVDWDYKRFLREARNHSASIPVFRGFHPASFGDTYYAYIRADGRRMLELLEKQSFTTNRIDEYASAGIYYFGSQKIFMQYAEALLQTHDFKKQEAYVSLLYNPMVADGLDVVIHEVCRFVCWGTPQDLEHYLFWRQYFVELKEDRFKSFHPRSESVNTALIPMAGRGARFRSEGYRVSKALIQVLGKPMIISACESFPKADNWIYLVQAEELAKHPIEKTLRKFSPECKVIAVDGVTSGQASTCLLADGLIQADSDLFIASCDYQTIYNTEKWNEILDDSSIDGAIWTCRLGRTLFLDPSAFAYCRVGEDGRMVTEVVEKRIISNHPERDPMVVGSFWFRRARDFMVGAKEMITRNVTVNGEHYVGTSINELLKMGHRFVIFDIEQWISFGNPFEIRVFEYWQDHFAERS